MIAIYDRQETLTWHNPKLAGSILMLNKGVIYGASAYILWGAFPIYFKSLLNVPPVQILFHRVVWSVIFLGLLLLLRKEWGAFRQAIGSPQVIGVYSIAACLLAANWLIYIWGVNSGQVVDTSLGYFINPLFSVALGVILLRERLRPLQWVPVGLAAAGVIYLTILYGSLPWIALALAFTFGTYGLLKKITPLGSLYGLALETAILFLPALGYLLFVESQGSGAFGHAGLATSVLLGLAGVITAVPLLLFGSAARSIPLSTIGLLQYLAPTGQFLLGVLVYREPFDTARMIGFACIWVALAIYTAEGLLTNRKAALLRSKSPA